MEISELQSRLVSWLHGDDRDDDVATSPVADAILALPARDLERASPEWGLAAAHYIERIRSLDAAKADRALQVLSILSRSKDELVGAQALAYAFFYEPNDERAASISLILRAGHDHVGYVPCLSSVKQVLHSATEKHRVIAQSAVDRISDSAIAYAELLLNLDEPPC